MRTNRTGNIKPETRNAMLDQLALAADRIVYLETWVARLSIVFCGAVVALILVILRFA